MLFAQDVARLSVTRGTTGLPVGLHKPCLNHDIFIHTMLHHGISSTHTDEDIDKVLEDIEATLRDVLAEGLNV